MDWRQWTGLLWGHNKMCLIRVKTPDSLIRGAIAERWIIQKRRGASSSVFPISTVSLAFCLCVSPCQVTSPHNHLLIILPSIAAALPQFVLFYSSPLFFVVPPYQIQCNDPLFLFFRLQCFYLTCPLALSLSRLSLFPPPVSGHWLLYRDCMIKCHSPT